MRIMALSGNPHAVSEHVTVLKSGRQSQITKCTTCCSLYHCPFCKPTVYKPNQLYAVQIHLQNHLNLAVRHEDYVIVKCNLDCRKTAHFHCCYCSATVIRRVQLISHISKCKPFQSSASQAVHRPPICIIQRLSTDPAQTLLPALTPSTPSSAGPALPSSQVHASPPPSPASPLLPPLQSSTPRPPSPSGPAFPLSLKMSPRSPSPSGLAFLPSLKSSPRSPSTVGPVLPLLLKSSPSPPPPCASSLPLSPSPSSDPSPAVLIPSRVKVQVQKQIRVKCIHCGMVINKKNLRTHLGRKHMDITENITARKHLKSQCIDRLNGIYAVEKSFFSPGTPIHVQKKTWGTNHSVICEMNQCNTHEELSMRDGFLPFECNHIKSLTFCTFSVEDQIFLKEEVLNQMVQLKWFGDEKKNICLRRKEMAIARAAPLSVELTIGAPLSKKYISVFEPKVSSYSRLGRVIVSYDTKTNSWSCPCNKSQRSCIHKTISKWHLFQTNKQLFENVMGTESDTMMDTFPQLSTDSLDEEDHEELERTIYPPDYAGVERMIQYLLKEKSLPASLPQSIVNASSRYSGIPKVLIPEETICTECPDFQILSDPMLITSKARVLAYTGVTEGVSTYFRTCYKCGMTYRYQEWKSGLHNFNDHLIITLHLCLVLRNSLQTHTAVSHVIEALEATANARFPSKEEVLQAYLHFEALTSLDYLYFCVTCGYYPAVAIMNFHKKGVFNMPGCEIKAPSSDFNGKVNIEQFWDAVTREIVSLGFLEGFQKNPFIVPPSYDFWAPWIGFYTRKDDLVLNTEHAKLSTNTLASEVIGPEMTADRLADELLNLKVEEVRHLCEQCGVDPNGSRMDLLLRLREQMMKSRSSFDKIFENVWGASGGWAVITCPCGVVYSIKRNIRAESPRDFADLLLSWNHIPNVSIYEFAGGLATHTNLRECNTLPFSPHMGRLLSPLPENVEKAEKGELTVDLPWLMGKKAEEDPDCHPLTGSSEHYALYNTFHESNTKDPRDVLRKSDLIPQLAGWIRSDTVEQLFASMRKNNYFMNSMTPSMQVFLTRNIIHHYNSSKNEKTSCLVNQENNETTEQ
ncbi:uncharacterized protein LOC120524049 [Polypterus senegalus]|uniref:uncharacterized protein LOC120524049 n=1 Tax=Polypterus senegalus TaxID=55291 RepID=UPI0019660340|nr:uncharacterized protein LOC120524049 [Polypterus senegalus]XP_039601822.1 uncharacterized protein LOC120524049 [Polypterus senegalus]